MVHRMGTDTRLLTACLKTEKEYLTSLKSFLSHSQASLAALNAYASSCPPAQATAMFNVVNALSGIDDAWKGYLDAVESWRGELKAVRKAEEVVGTVLRDREILVSKLIKVSHKRSTRDSVSSTAQANAFITDPSLTPLNPLNTSTATLTTSAKLNHAQAELQACEAHLAEKEKELEDIRENAIKHGLEKRCKALISCGWTWGEQGKQALRALDTLGAGRTESKTPYLQHDPNDSQLSSVTPSQSASQILLSIQPSDDSPAKSSSLAHPGSSPTPHRPSSPLRTTNPSASSPLHTLPVIHSEPEQEPDFKLNIGPAHSYDDHGNIHESIPSSALIQPAQAKKMHLVDSSDEELSKAPLEVHENNPFGQVSPKKLPAKPPSVTGARERGTLKRPPPQRQDSKSKVGFPKIGSVHKAKHSSDIGPRTAPTAPILSTGDTKYSPTGYKPDEYKSLARKRSTSFSLMHGFTGLFKSKKRSASAERSYPMSTGGWHTRTDKNLSTVRRGAVGAGAGSSSEDELPSTLTRRAKQLDQDQASVDTGEQKKLSKRISNTVHRHRKPIEEETGSKYIVVERNERDRPTGGLMRTGSHSSRRSEHISSSETARETAANTAMNSGQTRRATAPAEAFMFPQQRAGDDIMSRLSGDVNARDLSTSDQRVTELSRLSERLKRLEEVDRDRRGEKGERDIEGTRERESIPSLGPGKLEVVRAPPSMTQVPLMYHTEPSSLYPSSSSPRASTFKDTAKEGDVRGHRRMSSLSGAGTGMNAPLSNNNGGANLKPRPSTASNREPLKPALKSPRTSGTPLPTLPSILKRDGLSHETQGDRNRLAPPDRTGTASPPTPLGSKDGLLVNGDSIYVPSFVAGLRSPPTTSSSLVPTPKRLSEIPGSNRGSVVDDAGDDESVYETPDEDLSGEETEETIEGNVMIVNPVFVGGGALPSAETRSAIRPLGGDSPARGGSGTGTPPISIPGNGKHVPFKLNEPADLRDSTDRPRDSLEIESGQEGLSASTSTTSTSHRRKSVRMLIYPTVAVSPPDQYDDEGSPGPLRSRERGSPSPPRTPASGSTIRNSGHARASTGSGTGSAIRTGSGSSGIASGVAGNGAGGIPGGWETRINTSRNAWDDSSDEDEEYKSARRALSRGTEPYEGGRRRA